ncbi:MAG TPA: hypothetical protein VF412_10340 [Bdellovibrio sp.]|uniref:hypothetical protein n=1 Tax=Bdellovibrio sp. TaxID=28201 RepID=UPI002F0AC86F
MKTKLIAGVLIMGIVILAFKANEELKLSGSAELFKKTVDSSGPLSNSTSTVVGNSASLHEIGLAHEDSFSGLPTVNSIMDQYRTLSESELRAEIVRVSQIAESRDLYEKANSGRISQIERRDLAQIIRINTALHHLLIDRELERN